MYVKKMSGRIMLWATIALTWGLVYAAEDEPISGLSELPEDIGGLSTLELFDTLKINSGDDSKPKNDYVLDTNDFPGNVSVIDNGVNSTKAAASNTSERTNCTQHNFDTTEVELVDSTRLLNLLLTNPNITSPDMEAECVIVLFYAPWCPFSTLAAPHFNALPRAFPTIKMVAIDAIKYSSYNSQYGVIGVPSVLLFHNGRLAAVFNQSQYVLGMFSKFIEQNTGIPAVEKMFVTSADFSGPVSSTVVHETDYCLWMSWIFIAFSAMFLFTKTYWCHRIVEAIQQSWRECEAQQEHEHIN